MPREEGGIKRRQRGDAPERREKEPKAGAAQTGEPPSPQPDGKPPARKDVERGEPPVERVQERPAEAPSPAETPADQAQPKPAEDGSPVTPRDAEVPAPTPSGKRTGDDTPPSRQTTEPPSDASAPTATDAPPPAPKRQVIPSDEAKAKEIIIQERAKADQEFEKAKKAAEAGKDAPRVDSEAASRFENLRRQRKERVEKGGVAVIEEPDQRVIVRSKDRAFIQHDESRRLGRSAKEVRRERRPDGTTVVVNLGIGGVEITSIFNDSGQLLRRSRQDRGREVILIDNQDFYRRHRGARFGDPYVDLPPPRIRIPRERYVVEYDRASEADVYDALIAPPVERLERSYSLEEVRYSEPLRERMRRIDLDTINFAFASWEVDPRQFDKLQRIADAMLRIIERNPDEIFLLEGHTDAVGSEIDNLSLSDRRAESVAIVLSDTFRVPPENLTTQGYGEEFLKVNTLGPSRENRRVAVRRITPLLSRR